MAGSIEGNAALYKKKNFTYVPPSPPAELIESTNYTLDFTNRKFVHIGVDPTENFQVAVHILTSSRHVKISPDFLRRIFSMMGHILSFILDTVQYKRIIFLETDSHKISSMVYGGENVLVIESKTQDGCRVLLNRADIIRLQYLECSIFESIVRKEEYTAPLIIKQSEEFVTYIYEKCASLKSPPKTLEDMLIFIKNIQDDRTEKTCPNMINQIQMCAAVQLAESVLNRMSHESQNVEIDSSMSPISSIHDDPLLRCATFRHSKSIDDLLQVPDGVEQSFDVNDGPNYFSQFRAPSQFITPPPPTSLTVIDKTADGFEPDSQPWWFSPTSLAVDENDGPTSFNNNSPSILDFTGGKFTKKRGKPTKKKRNSNSV